MLRVPAPRATTRLARSARRHKRVGLPFMEVRGYSDTNSQHAQMGFLGLATSQPRLLHHGLTASLTTTTSGDEQDEHEEHDDEHDLDERPRTTCTHRKSLKSCLLAPYTLPSDVDTR